MRVRRQPDILSIMRLREVVSLSQPVGQDEDGQTMADLIAAPEPPSDPNDVVDAAIFQRLEPGNERVCLVLIADG